MKILNIVGKVDSRVIVYPLARALGLAGITCVVTDDGAYRRLFHGRSGIGNVSGVDLVVSNRVDNEAIQEAKGLGLDYDYLLLVSNDFIYDHADGVLVCHGVDRSMLQYDAESDDEDDKFFIMLKEMSEASKLADEIEKEGAKSNKRGKKVKKLAEKVDSSTEEATHATLETLNDAEKSEVEFNDVAETAEENFDETTDESKVETAESVRDTIIKLQNENPDKVVVPDGINMQEIQIAYAPVPKHGIPAISLKEGLMQYVYNCEETKSLGIAGKEVNTILCKVIPGLIGMDAKDLSIFLQKEEGSGGITKDKKKK